MCPVVNLPPRLPKSTLFKYCDNLNPQFVVTVLSVGVPERNQCIVQGVRPLCIKPNLGAVGRWQQPYHNVGGAATQWETFSSASLRSVFCLSIALAIRVVIFSLHHSYTSPLRLPFSASGSLPLISNA